MKSSIREESSGENEEDGWLRDEGRGREREAKRRQFFFLGGGQRPSPPTHPPPFIWKTNEPRQHGSPSLRHPSSLHPSLSFMSSLIIAPTPPPTPPRPSLPRRRCPSPPRLGLDGTEGGRGEGGGAFQMDRRVRGDQQQTGTGRTGIPEYRRDGRSPHVPLITQTCGVWRTRARRSL